MVIRRHKLVIASCLALAFALAIIYCLVAPRRYEAMARLVINPTSDNPLGMAEGGMSNLFQDPTLMQATEVQIMQSDTVIWDVICRLRLDKNPDFAKIGADQSLDNISPSRRIAMLEEFHRRLRVTMIPKTSMVEMRFRSKNPKLAAEIVNATANAYLERNFRTHYDTTMQASDWLSKQLNDLKQKVEASQQQLVDFQKKSGIIGTDETHNSLLTQLDELNKGLAATQAERIVREATYREALGGNPDVIAEIAPTVTMQALRAQQVDLNNQYAQLSAQYGDAYPRVKQLRTQLSQVDASLQAETNRVLRRLESEYKTASRAEKMAIGEVEKSKQQAYKMNEAGIEYLILKNELEASRDLYQGLMKKLEEAGIVASLKSTNINVVDAAEIPVNPAEPGVLLTLLISLIVGSAGGLGLAFLLENLDTTVSSPEHVKLFSRMPLLCTVPHIILQGHNSTRPLEECEKKRPLSLVRPQSAFAESYRALRTSLLLSTAGCPPKSIVITSAVPGEGKTTTAINAAVAFAQNKHRVLLIDADMRRGGLQEALGFAGCQGLSGCLTGAYVMETAVVSIPELPGLHILPAGARPPFPAELLSSDEMRRLLERWKADYDHVIFDTPPILGLTDAAILASMVDAVLLVARCGKTGRQALSRAIDALACINASRSGVVLNDLNSSEHYGYYGYYGKEYEEYYGERSLKTENQK
jgi:capsular exopolysaccharide synthesis family protein